jgi:hypothetical protein
VQAEVAQVTHCGSDLEPAVVKSIPELREENIRLLQETQEE